MSLNVRIWAAALAVCVFGHMAVAAEVSPIPGGSWRDSCEGGNLSGLVLSANCRRMDGSMRQAQLRITDCGQPTRAGNNDGQLVCESGPRQVPTAGSWAQSCVFEELSGPMLSAYCVRKNGSMITSSLDLTTCIPPTAVANQDGQLTCEGGVRQRQTLQELQMQQPQTQGGVIIVQPGNQTVVPLIEGLGIIFGVQP